MFRAKAALWRIAGCTLAALGVAALIATQGSARADRPPVQAPASLDVQPFPGTPDASPQTTIAFPRVARAQLVGVRVWGSRSGLHAGHLHSLVDGGTEFVPDHQFVDRDRVTVDATLRSPSAGTASGAPGASKLSFSFEVRRPASIGSVAQVARAQTAVRHDIRDSNGFTHSFYSMPWIHPPITYEWGKDPDPAQGDIFADAASSIQAGPMIMDPNGNLLYFQPLGKQAAYDVNVQTYDGQPMLTYWQGYAGRYGDGVDEIYNDHYQLVKTVSAAEGLHADEHEFYVTPQGDAFITAYQPVADVNLRSVGGPKSGTLVDSIIQEINISTGQLLWEWHAYGHVSLRETYIGKPSNVPYDFFHINSIQQLPNGNLLVSARNTWTIYEINMRTGKIPYNFGGKNYFSFKFDHGANFEWQHDAAMLPGGDITVFDDGEGYYRSEPQSRALILRPNYKTHRLALVHAFTHNPPLLTPTQGSAQVLGDGNTFVGWGYKPYFTEFSNSGKMLFNVRFPLPLQSYRGFRHPWSALPYWSPDIATKATTNGTAVYASWNGATAFTYWRVLAGTSPTDLSAVGKFGKGDFETRMWVPLKDQYFAVQALSQYGTLRTTSTTVARGASSTSSG